MCLRILGHMCACTQVVQFAKLCLCPLQMWPMTDYCLALQPLDRLIHLLPVVLDSLQWWMCPQNVCQGILFVWPSPTKSVVTSASLLGWWVHLGLLKVHGLWSVQEVLLHINFLELQPIYSACQAFWHCIRDLAILILTDNTTVNVNKQGCSA